MNATNNFKPILFSTEMVQAILEGRKTQTRRVLKLKTPVDIAGVEVDCYLRLDLIPTNMQVFYANKTDKQINLYSDNEYAKYKPGDVLWVRETFGTTTIGTMYKANVCSPDCDKPLSGWKPSLFMPKEAARIFLKVTNVRCERLQDISEEDAIAEGIERYGPFGEFKGDPHPSGGMMRFRAYSKAARAFQDLWDSINAKKHPWKSNPWVWVYDFERIEKPADFN